MDSSITTSQSLALRLLTPPSSQPDGINQPEYHFQEVDIWDDEHWLNIDPVILRNLLSILYKDLGHLDWQPGQLPAIRHAIEGKDVFVALPTGGGKSAIYQIAGLYQNGPRKGVTVIFTPLVALMKDQVLKLLKRSIKALCIYHDMPDRLKQLCWAEAHASTDLRFLFITPERIEYSIDNIGKIYDNGRLARFVIDEAHCVVQWGETFRGAYLSLGESLRKSFKDVPIVALTAPLSKSHIQQTVKALNIEGCQLVTLHPDRRNLRYHVEEGKNVPTKIATFLKSRPPQSGIIFCRTPNYCDHLVGALVTHGIIAKAYHSGPSLSDEDRSRIYMDWMSDKCRIVVATSAFGLGIDKPNVRFVIHRDMPIDIGSFYQQSGRAGRDGKPADCILYYSYHSSQLSQNLELRRGSQPSYFEAVSQRMRENVIKPAHDLMKMCMDYSTCRRHYILDYFGWPYEETTECGACDNCLRRTSDDGWIKEDFYPMAIDILLLFEVISRSRRKILVTPQQLACICTGTGEKRFKDLHDECVSSMDNFRPFFLPGGKMASKDICKGLIESLVVNDIFEEYPRFSKDHIHWYLKEGRHFEEFKREKRPHYYYIKA